ncbi:MAG: SpoIIE family protein phosphatase, partial [Coriobacteriales bacterium]|nr:SpoIIE family protein phosphatase [Coriobacteriales bacterium]
IGQTVNANPFELAAALLAASFALSTVWLQYLTAIYAAYGYADFVAQIGGVFGSPSFLGQVLFDWIVWLVAAGLVDALMCRALCARISRAIRAVFGRWLFLVVAFAFLATTTVSYCFSTWQALGEANSLLTSEVSYLLGQADAHAARGEDISGLADGYAFGSGGTVIILEDGKVASANIPIDEIGEEDIRQIQIEAVSDELRFSQDMETLGVRYFKVARSDHHTVYVSIPAVDIFAHRTATITLNTLCYLLLFAAVYALLWWLLDRVVVRGFKRTTDVLARITAGDLEQRVDEHGSEEFDAFSEGINTTVDALKGWIAEVERRMEQDLETGRAIQRGVLPKTFPPFPNIGTFDLYASMDAALEVGGDFYSFFLVDERTLGFLIADVSGKGIPGALFMMTAKTQIERYMSAGLSLAEAVSSANQQLCEGNDAGMFVTLWAATLVWETGELTYCNAGHNFPLLRHGAGGEWEWLKKKCGLFLGTFETAKYRQETLMLEPGDELILYTDGVNEAFSADDEEYGNDRLEAFLAAHNDLGPEELVTQLRADVAAWAEGAEQSDDITILALEYKGDA